MCLARASRATIATWARRRRKAHGNNTRLNPKPETLNTQDQGCGSTPTLPLQRRQMCVQR